MPAAHLLLIRPRTNTHAALDDTFLMTHIHSSSMLVAVSAAKEVPLTVSAIKQIAGRAGRRGTIYSEGAATCLHAKDIPRLKVLIRTMEFKSLCCFAGTWQYICMSETMASWKMITHGFADTVRWFAAANEQHVSCAF